MLGNSVMIPCPFPRIFSAAARIACVVSGSFITGGIPAAAVCKALLVSRQAKLRIILAALVPIEAAGVSAPQLRVDGCGRHSEIDCDPRDILAGRVTARQRLPVLHRHGFHPLFTSFLSAFLRRNKKILQKKMLNPFLQSLCYLTKGKIFEKNTCIRERVCYNTKCAIHLIYSVKTKGSAFYVY